MLQVNLIRQNAEEVKRRLAVKNFTAINLVDEIIALDEERKKLVFQFDETKAGINAASKEIGQLMSRGEKEKADAKRKKRGAIKRKTHSSRNRISRCRKKTH